LDSLHGESSTMSLIPSSKPRKRKIKKHSLEIQESAFFEKQFLTKE